MMDQATFTKLARSQPLTDVRVRACWALFVDEIEFGNILAVHVPDILSALRSGHGWGVHEFDIYVLEGGELEVSQVGAPERCAARDFILELALLEQRIREPPSGDPSTTGTAGDG